MTTGRTADEIRRHLLTRLNFALRQSGTVGGEPTFYPLFDALAFAEDVEERWQAAQDRLWKWGASGPSGVAGTVREVWGRRSDDVVDSVYGELAFGFGWLDLDRTLTPEEYRRLRDTVGAWCEVDRGWRSVENEFGPPSVVFGGTDPLYAKTLAYAPAESGEPVVFFHLWNGVDPGSAKSWPPSYAEPQLLAGRRGGETFLDGFTFTPRGLAHQAHAGT
jgi:hypothetical protein